MDRGRLAFLASCHNRRAAKRYLRDCGLACAAADLDRELALVTRADICRASHMSAAQIEQTCCRAAWTIPGMTARDTTTTTTKEN
jgi:hypothetical protein